MSNSVTPWTLAHQAPQSMGFPRQEYWSKLPFPSPGEPPDPGIELLSPVSPALQADSLPLAVRGNPCCPRGHSLKYNCHCLFPKIYLKLIICLPKYYITVNIYTMRDAGLFVNRIILRKNTMELFFSLERRAKWSSYFERFDMLFTTVGATQSWNKQQQF